MSELQVWPKLSEVSKLDSPHRWNHYWQLAVELLETEPGSTEELVRQVVELENRIAASEGQLAIDQSIADYRQQSKQEAAHGYRAAVAELLAEFPDETSLRTAVNRERHRVATSLRAYLDSTDPRADDANARYVLALDELASFGTALSEASLHEAGKANASPAGEVPGAGQSSVPQMTAAHDRPAVQHHKRSSMGRADPERARAETRTVDNGGTMKPRFAGISILVALALVVGLGAGIWLKPEIVNPAWWRTLIGGSNSATVEDLLEKLGNMSEGSCERPIQVSNANWQEMRGFFECARTARTALIEDFKSLVVQAGGQWTPPGSWVVPQGPRRQEITKVWENVSKVGADLAKRVSDAVVLYNRSFFESSSEDQRGWRFTVWRCRCNENGGFSLANPESARLRLFVAGAERVDSADQAKRLIDRQRTALIGAGSAGHNEAVAWAAQLVALDYGLKGGGAVSKPYETREAATRAAEDLTALHAFIGFKVQ